MFKKLSEIRFKKLRLSHRQRVIVGVFLIVIAFFAFWNGANQMIFASKCSPNTRFGAIDVSGVSYEEIENKIRSSIESREIGLKNGGLFIKSTANDLGIELKSNEANEKCKSKNPLLNKPWFVASKYEIPLKIDKDKLSEKLVSLRDQEYKEPQDSKIVIKDGKLFVAESSDGYGISVENTEKLIFNSLNSSNENLNIELKSEILEPTLNTQEVNTLVPEVEKIISYSYKVKYREGLITATKGDILGVLVLNGNDAEPSVGYSKENITVLVSEWVKQAEKSPVNQIKEKYKSGRAEKITRQGEVGFSVNNSDEIAEALFKALENGETAYEGEFKFDEKPFEEKIIDVDDTVKKRIVTYDVAVWGSVKSDLQEFESLAAQTYADSRGWNAAGISFVKVSSGGNFTLVLAEPSRVAAISPGCDSYYSCSVGRYVIINDDRWAGATSVWTGSLRDYRHMVVNHETGHWLGHGHYNCQGAGQSAPVMQQQSINLQGCLFNPWPLEFEINKIKS